MKEKIQRINPDTLMNSPAFSQVVVTNGNGRTIYIGGQNAVTKDRQITGKGDLGLQTEQVMQNIINALEACNATLENLVKLTIYIVQGQNVYSGFQASQKYFANSPHLPVISGVIVAALANPDFLIEIDAIAFIPE